MNPVWRNNHFFVSWSYMMPACHVNGPLRLELSAEEKARVAQLADRRQSGELLAARRVLVVHRVVDEHAAADVQRREAEVHLEALDQRAALRLAVRFAGGELVRERRCRAVVSRPARWPKPVAAPTARSPSEPRRQELASDVRASRRRCSILIEIALDRRQIRRLQQREAQQHARLLRIQSRATRRSARLSSFTSTLRPTSPGRDARRPHADDALLRLRRERLERGLRHVAVADAGDHDALRAGRRRPR